MVNFIGLLKSESGCVKYAENIRWEYEMAECPHCLSFLPYKTNRGYLDIDKVLPL